MRNGCLLWLLMLFTDAALAETPAQLALSLARSMGVPTKYRRQETVRIVTFPLLPGTSMVFNRYNGISFDDYGTSLPFAIFLSLTSVPSAEKFYDRQLTAFHKVVKGNTTVYFADDVKSLDNHPVENIDKVWLELQPYMMGNVEVTLIKMNYRPFKAP